jgi:hypothetical protein
MMADVDSMDRKAVLFVALAMTPSHGRSAGYAFRNGGVDFGRSRSSCE